MKIWNVVFVWMKNENGVISTNIRQQAFTEKEAVSMEEAVGKFLVADFKKNIGYSIHCWQCNEVTLTDKTE